MPVCILLDAGLVCDGQTRSQVQGLVVLTGMGCALAGIGTLALVKQRLIRISTAFLILAAWSYTLSAALGEIPRLTPGSLLSSDRSSVVFKIISTASLLAYMLYILSAMLSCFTMDWHAFACAVFGVAAAASVGLGIAPPWISSHANGGRTVYVDDDQYGLFDGMGRGSIASELVCQFVLLIAIWRFWRFARFDESLDEQKISLLAGGTALGILSSIIALALPHQFVAIMFRRGLVPGQIFLYSLYVVLGGHYLRPPWALKIADWEEEGEYRDGNSFDDAHRDNERRAAYDALESNRNSPGTSVTLGPSPGSIAGRRHGYTNYSDDPFKRYDEHGRPQNMIKRMTPTFFSDKSSPMYEHPPSRMHDRPHGMVGGRSHSNFGRRDVASSYNRGMISKDSIESVESAHDASTPDSWELKELHRNQSYSNLSRNASRKRSDSDTKHRPSPMQSPPLMSPPLSSPSNLGPSYRDMRYRDDPEMNLRNIREKERRLRDERERELEREMEDKARELRELRILREQERAQIDLTPQEPNRAVIYGTTEASKQMAERRHHRMDSKGRAMGGNGVERGGGGGSRRARDQSLGRRN